MASLAFLESGKLIRLLQLADQSGRMKVSIAGNEQLALGEDPLNPSVIVDFAEERAIPNASNEEARNTSAAPFFVELGSSTGRYWFELEGQRWHFGALKDLLGACLTTLEKMAPGTLEKLSHIKPRSKRIVARDRALLFQNPNLTEYSAPLFDGWWFGTNNSAQETNAWLERAALCAGLTWGHDLRTNL